MESDAVIEDIIHEITIIFVSVNAKKSPAIRPVNETIASCMPKMIADLVSNFFRIMYNNITIFVILSQVKNRVFV